MRVLQVSRMDESKVRGVQDEFFKFFEVEGFLANTIQSPLAEKMKAIVIDGKDTELVKMIIGVLKKSYNEKLVNASLELLNHPDVNVRRRASEVFKRNDGAAKDIFLKAYESLEDVDSFYRANAESAFYGKYFSHTSLVILLDKSMSSEPEERKKAKTLIGKLMNKKEFDSSLKYYLDYENPYSAEVKKIFESKDFKGLSSVQQVLSRDASEELRKIAIDKVRNFDDLNFVAVTQGILGNYWNRIGVRAILPLILERDLNKSEFDYSEYSGDAFHLLREDEFRGDAEKLLMKIEPTDSKDPFFAKLLNYARYSPLELLTSVARLAAHNIKREGIGPVIDILRAKSTPEIQKILDEASSPAAPEQSQGLSCRPSLAAH
jgi:hypothetical protein